MTLYFLLLLILYHSQFNHRSFTWIDCVRALCILCRSM